MYIAPSSQPFEFCLSAVPASKYFIVPMWGPAKTKDRFPSSPSMLPTKKVEEIKHRIKKKTLFIILMRWKILKMTGEVE